MTRPKRSGESGQAMIIAVLLMLVVAGVAGLFITIVAVQLARAARQSDAVRAQQYADAAIRYAQYNLVNSPEGAGWRPQSGTYQFGGGQWDLGVTYRPAPGDPYSQYLKIEAVGRTRDNTLVPRRALEFAAIGLTDYARWITNPNQSPTPTALGVPLLGEWNPSPSYYRTEIKGPLRVNGDLEWHSRARVILTRQDQDPSHLRDDQVEVAGRITQVTYPDPPAQPFDLQIGNQPTDPVHPVYASDNPNFTTWAGRYRDGLQENDASGGPRWVRRLEPPNLLRGRYLDLTRHTGYWRQDQSDGNRWYQTGYYVTPGEQGDGLYVDNSADIQFGNDYEAMRDNLLGKTALYWDAPGALNYQPPGAEIELHPTDDPGNPHGGRPYVRITRHDGGFYQPNPAGTTPLEPLGSVDVPYPRNGVIFLLGNARVRGTLPALAGSPGSRYYQDADNRHFHLTIVSMGNIFIEGNLLSPLTAGLTADPAKDSKLALLARGWVVLNATRMAMRPVYHPYSVANECYQVQDGEPFEGWFSLAGTPAAALKLLLWHAGAENPAATGHAGQTVMNLLLNGTPFDWSLGGAQTTRDDPNSYYLFKPDPTWTSNNETNAVAPEREPLPQAGTGFDKTITLDDTHYLVRRDGSAGWPEPGVEQRVRIEVPFDSPRDYWLYRIGAQGADAQLEVDALIYAQAGSWFIVPGAWFNDDPNALPSTIDPTFPLYHEPLDLQVTVKGAISEGRAADLSDALDWVSKWRGSDENWQSASGTSSRGLNYIYDSSLRAALDPTDPSSPPCLPGLPVSSMLIAYGERM